MKPLELMMQRVAQADRRDTAMICWHVRRASFKQYVSIIQFINITYKYRFIHRSTDSLIEHVYIELQHTFI